MVGSSGRRITRPASHARPKGQQSASGATDGTADTLQVDVPTHDEHGVHNRHNNRITRVPARCPAVIHYVDSRPGEDAAGEEGHASPNPAISDQYSRIDARIIIHFSGRDNQLPLPDPAHSRLRRRRLGSGELGRRLMLAVAPVPARAILVMPLPARVADHAFYCAACPGPTRRRLRARPGRKRADGANGTLPGGVTPF
jgi:hypothetical protein